MENSLRKYTDPLQNQDIGDERVCRRLFAKHHSFWDQNNMAACHWAWSQFKTIGDRVLFFALHTPPELFPDTNPHLKFHHRLLHYIKLTVVPGNKIQDVALVRNHVRVFDCLWECVPGETALCDIRQPARYHQKEVTAFVRDPFCPDNLDRQLNAALHWASNLMSVLVWSPQQPYTLQVASLWPNSFICTWQTTLWRDQLVHAQRIPQHTARMRISRSRWRSCWWKMYDIPCLQSIS